METLTLRGRTVTLEPLDPRRHADELWAALRGAENDALWTYMHDGPYAGAQAFAAAVERKAAARDAWFFALLAPRAAGYASFMREDAGNRVIEVGSIMYSPSLQRTAAGTEAMYLMARHVFETLRYRRYEWKCNALNEPSRRAALRLGFQFEGIFRQHMLVKGRNRDTAWFSMLDHEWPARKTAFEAWLDPANFDAHGRQRTPLG